MAAALVPATEAAIREVIARSATQGERIVSAGRLAMVLVALGRSAWMWSTFEYPEEPAPVLAQAALILVTAAFSGFVVLRYRTRVAPPGLFAASVTVDAAICFAALAGNALWPGPVYPGLAFLPDVAAVLVPVAAAGLRLSPAVAAYAGALNLASLFGVVALDAALTGPPLGRVVLNLTAVVALLAAVTLLSVLTAARSRALARAGAEKMLEAERAERNLGVLLRDHHDVRTLLSSASLNADLVLRSLQAQPLAERVPEDVGESARQLREDLDRVNEFVASIKERSYADLLSLRAPDAAPAAAAAAQVAAQLRGRFPEVEIALSDESDGAAALVAGGATALERMLQNLLVNACEGDGRRAAAKVELWIAAPARDPMLRIEVRDDGPGFPAAVLEAGGARVATSKRDGSGLGLGLVRELAEASGGRLELANRPEGGARVSLELPRARGARARA